VRNGQVLIIGSGAMACLFGGLLASVAEVTLLGTWQEGVQAVRSRGIKMEDEKGVRTVRVRATDDPAMCAGSSQALVLVKAWQTRRAAQQLEVALAPDGLALTLQNGLGNLEILQQRLGEGRVAAGVSRRGATLVGPGHIRLGGSGPIVLEQNARLDELAELFEQAGVSVEWVGDASAAIWGKLAVNAGINPLAALLRMTNGVLAEQPQAQAVMRRAAQEVQAVASARGIALPYSDAGEEAVRAATASAHNLSSMLQDVLRGARTEVDAINGAVVGVGKEVGVETPVNRVLWELVTALTAKPQESAA
jgi:2-dehydropantoate 2-reductase